MKNFTLFVLLFLFSNCSFEQNILTKSEFTEKIAKIFIHEFPTGKFDVVTSLEIKATFSTDEETIHLLYNLYNDYKLEPENIEQIIEQYILTIKSLNKNNNEINSEKIVPIIKTKNYLEDVKNFDEGDKAYKVEDLVWETYNDDLIILYGEDEGTSLSYFNKKDFEMLNINKDSLRKIAIRNMLKIIPEIEISGEDGSFMLIAGGTYEASLILDQSIWNKLNFDVDGEIIVAIPNRDIIIITGSKDKKALKKHTPFVKKCFNTYNYSISTNFYKWNGNIFEKSND